MTDWSKPYVLRIDSRPEKTEVEELFESPQPNIGVPVINRNQANYRVDCMTGQPHPLSIERHHYVLETICTQSIKAGVFQDDERSLYKRSNRFSPLEMDFITSIQRRPEVAWAIDNSFDGIYVRKYEDHARMATSFQFAVYMKEEHATFWRLKYSGR